MSLSKSNLKTLKRTAEKAADANDEEALTNLALAAVRKADMASELWRVATAGPFHEATLGEDVFPAAVLDAVILQVATFTKPADRARGLSLAARMTAFSPLALIERNVGSREDKPSLIEALNAPRTWLCEELAAKMGVSKMVRAAAALALGRCGDETVASQLLADLGPGPEPAHA